ncbi:MAG: group II intron reverse transcriptase/maturase [Actinomycetota bacterium]
MLTTLAHHIDLDFLRTAHRAVRKDGVPGVDDQTAAAYAEGLEENLQDLLDRFKSGWYKAPPVKRAHIPKGEGKTRPIGIPTFEDKVLQRAVAMVLEAVYEEDFLDCSYGFRPGRSAHQALDAVWKGLMDMGGGWVVDVDIQSFFDTVDHAHLRGFLDQRVRDGVLRRTIDKWLKAGVMEAGVLSRPEEGTPQGGVISPLLANVYLHHVLDRWFREQVRPRLRGRAFLVRYADDLVIACAREDDARRVLEVLPKRLRRYGLSLHPTKTRLVRFERPRDGQGPEGGAESGSFDFLGFTHFWSRSRRGAWVVKRKTAKDRLRRAVKRVSVWCRQNRHRPVAWQHEQLTRKLLGHYGYYGITPNHAALARYLRQVERTWQKWLHRRSQRKAMPWERFRRLLERYPLPRPRIVHRATVT